MSHQQKMFLLKFDKREIYFPGQYFVPLLRSEDNSSQPFIGTPWSPESSRCGVNLPPMSWSPKDPLMAVKACAGPMTPSKVECHNFFLTEVVKSSSQLGCQGIVQTDISWHACIVLLSNITSK